MIAKIFMKKHEKRKEKLQSQSQLQQSQSQLTSSSSSQEDTDTKLEQKTETENEEETEENGSDRDDEKSDKPITKKSAKKGSKSATASETAKKSASDMRMDSSFMEEGIERTEFLDIGKEFGFHEAHLQMLWEQINEFQSNEIHFHQWFQYLEPIDITENNPKDNPNLSSVTGIRPKEKTSTSNPNLGNKRPPKNDQV
ncbi:hypothetical protein RFI_00253 [Reticulomyxa filosa]|uniref:Uncharacterized protein n=1 Tax=Reticulomyxa filosa TaxID=46433 RepID=X6PFH2_RETFI|nr:hypothetical protein RFI_00253 [Reticulomyxa filosa]|eukprot:ETO36809.1 hypothetical protein RFI_00253 [Reticulomyxa filosa]